MLVCEHKTFCRLYLKNFVIQDEGQVLLNMCLSHPHLSTRPVDRISWAAYTS